ncbi:hypothetical protein Bhyg_07357 [Pseudolycoriella hygida]|uniref:Uncharacterized protein n=1 Tax=Pseudolycoriella hygida TaxID=35572 RepID=A0A9Q0N2F8_9DIPT|nr:hypothetical protein Bhyg_07357 [Pseudolycoriella hygida]
MRKLCCGWYQVDDEEKLAHISCLINRQKCWKLIQAEIMCVARFSGTGRFVYVHRMDIEKEELHDVAPPRFIEIQKGKISLAPAKPFESAKDKDLDYASYHL